jgi:hypothetical protein
MEQKLLLDSASLSGRVRSVQTVNGAGDTIATRATAYNPSYSRGWPSPGAPDTSIHDPWPQGVAVNRVLKVQSRERADNRSRRTATSTYNAHDDRLEIPLFTIAIQGERAAIDQIILDEEGVRVKQRLAFDYPASELPSKSQLNSSRATPLETNGAAGKYALGWVEIGYDERFPRKANYSVAWRDPGGSWDDEELKSGPIPDFQPGQNAFIPSEVTRRDSLGQVLETREEISPEGYRYSSLFYEGRAALPVGSVSNASRGNTAILMAENGSIPQLLALGTLDRDAIWSGPGVTYSATRAHTGRFSFKVTDHFGPSGNLHLSGVRDGGFGFVASAWIYGDMNDAPVFAVSRRRANGDQQDYVLASPVGGAYQSGKWQRWEAVLSHQDLIADDMFEEESGDYLRIFIGTHGGGSLGNPARVIYVDDIVLRPDNSLFSLGARNERGQATQVTDTHHQVRTHEYGFAGQPAGIRDERGRVFGQQGFNRPGENQP